MHTKSLLSYRFTDKDLRIKCRRQILPQEFSNPVAVYTMCTVLLLYKTQTVRYFDAVFVYFNLIKVYTRLISKN